MIFAFLRFLILYHGQYFIFDIKHSLSKPLAINTELQGSKGIQEFWAKLPHYLVNFNFVCLKNAYL